MKDLVEVMDENNNENKALIKAFDSEPGYYNQVIRAMLTPGHESELIFWFKHVGLISSSQICKKAPIYPNCNKLMEWVPAKTVDYFQWKCRSCGEKRGIRENSLFQDIRCNFTNSIRTLLGWCKGYDIDYMANMLGVKKATIRALYGAISATAKKSLKFHPHNQKLGGTGVVVLVDTYPEGCSNYCRPSRGNHRPIFCLTEIKDIPPKCWFEALDRFSGKNENQVKLIKEHNLKVIQEIVLPGSILVCRLNSTLCSYYDLQSLKHIYTIISVEGLSRHDSYEQTIFDNLDTIWKFSFDVCEAAQSFPYEQVSNFLISQMWQSRFGDEAFEMLVNRLTDTQ